jgi:hypothetical protein
MMSSNTSYQPFMYSVIGVVCCVVVAGNVNWHHHIQNPDVSFAAVFEFPASITTDQPTRLSSEHAPSAYPTSEKTTLALQ